MRYSDLTKQDRAALAFYTQTGEMGRLGTDDCAFCGHSLADHAGSAGFARGCAAESCGDETLNRGRCAVYTSQEQAAENRRWFDRLDMPVMVTPRQVANRFHERRYGKGQEHFGIHSCPCSHEAMYYLGVEDKIGFFWPDGQGGNAWDPHGLDAK